MVKNERRELEAFGTSELIERVIMLEELIEQVEGLIKNLE